MADFITALSSLLRCPITGQQLHIATPDELRALSDHEGHGFLVREDGTGAYPVLGGIPSLLPESLLPLDVPPTA
jgi:uncharacterized protein YbaR (Trm112 family)